MGVIAVFPLKTGGFDVRWVRLLKHILLFSPLFKLESEGFGDFSVWVQEGGQRGSIDPHLASWNVSSC